LRASQINVAYEDHMGSDLRIVNAARVSFNKRSCWKEYEENSLLAEDERLINYLAKNKHFSPFNHAFITVVVDAPIFVARQLVKHEYMPWNEVSRRYVDDPPEFFMPEGLRAKAEKVKQGSSENFVEDNDVLLSDFTAEIGRAAMIYDHLIEKGVCPEQARLVLPQNTMTQWYWSGSLKAFAKMLQLRLDSHTQKETRLVAQQIHDIILPKFPVSLPALLRSSL
jgi:thymidylate synthase (FAD)